MEFGPIRAMATLGWMAGCWLVSVLNADTSTLAGYSGATAWLVVCGFTFFLPVLATRKSAENLWREHKKEEGIVGNRDRRTYLAGVMEGFRDKLEAETKKQKAEGLVWVGDAS